MIIDRSKCNVGLPKLTIEGFPHSPLMHMKLQSGLIQKLSSRFGTSKSVKSPADVQEYKSIIEAWIEALPSPFRVHNPDRILDKSYPWIILHRHYLRTMSFSMLMDPIRAYLAKPQATNLSEAELRIREDGIKYCLELMASLHGFFNHVYPRDAKFHFVLFCIFDTATVLSSAMLHDVYQTLPRRDEVYKAIDEAYYMLVRLSAVTKSAKASAGILSRIMQRLPRNKSLHSLPKLDSAKRSCTAEVAVYPPTDLLQIGIPQSPLITLPQNTSPPTTISPGQSVSPPYMISPPHTVSPPILAPPTLDTTTVIPTATAEPNEHYELPVSYIDWQAQAHAPVMEEPYQAVSFADISEEDLHDLAMWNYQSLDFSFITPSITL